MKRKTVISLLLAAAGIPASVSAVSHFVTKTALAKIGALEAECLKQYTETNTLRSISDRDRYLSDMEPKLNAKRKELFIQQMNKGTDGIYITLYTGIHYVISPPVEGMK